MTLSESAVEEAALAALRDMLLPRLVSGEAWAKKVGKAL